MAKRPKKLSAAAQQIIDAHQVPQDDVIPYDPATHAAIMQQVQEFHTWQNKQFRAAARDCYFAVVPWFRAAYHEAQLVDDYVKATNEVFYRAGLEWQERTGHPMLHDDPGWRMAVLAAGYPANRADEVPTSANLISTVAAWAALEWRKAEQKPADGYLGNGRIRIDGKLCILTQVRQIRFVETLLDNHGVATSGMLEDEGAKNPSEVRNKLEKLDGGILKPYFPRPAKKGGGYSTTLPDAR